MKAGNFERALEAFAAALKENPSHPGASKDFPEALIALKNAGDEASRHGRLEEAGKSLSASLRFLSHPALKGKLSFSRTDVRGSIDRVSSTLMEKGLMDYRKGNIEGAIVSWKSILAYDPAHEEAARSVRTATTQLENLKKLGAPK
jgi:tetratricopeptide (TPR) repeat protein